MYTSIAFRTKILHNLLKFGYKVLQTFVKMIGLLCPQVLKIHGRENKRNSLRPLRMSSSVLTRFRFIEETSGFEAIKKFIPQCS